MELSVYPDVDEANQLNDDRVGRLLDALFDFAPQESMASVSH